MNPPGPQHAIRLVAQRLAELLGVGTEGESADAPTVGEGSVDVGGFTFAVQWRSSGNAVNIDAAASRAVEDASSLGGTTIPLVAVPFMGDVGRARCEAAGAAWLDLSGNALIIASGLRIRVDGQPNQFKRPGRPSSAFAPKSARIARWLLLHPDAAPTQREVARATDMGEGFTSRIVSRLEGDDLIERRPDGAIRARNPDLLLDAWREDYDFSKHDIRRGHIPARSGDGLVRQLGAALTDASVEHAATGLAAAWLYTRFAGFRLVTLYLAEPPREQTLRDIGFREEAAGANVWLVVPNDAGVFHGAAEVDGMRCVHPVQVYLDLAAHPERAKEAAAHLRAEALRWSDDG